jgi:hypothetical protein
MKFVYVDESGAKDHTDVFVMAGVLIDAYRLRKHTTTFDEMITTFLAKHEGAPKELKTHAFIDGDGGWSKIDAAERKAFLGSVCDLVAECARIFAVAFSFEKFDPAAKAAQQKTFGTSYWLGAAMFVSALVQQKMQKEKRNKGHTVLMCDDNKKEMPKLADALYAADPWFDPIYEGTRRKKRGRKGKRVGNGALLTEERFDQIVNTAFSIKSHHSSMIQVADAVSYIYRRHLELKSGTEAWAGEKEYFAGLVNKLEPKRELLGRTSGGPCIEFYESVSHDEWRL